MLRAEALCIGLTASVTLAACSSSSDAGAGGADAASFRDAATASDGAVASDASAARDSGTSPLSYMIGIKTNGAPPGRRRSKRGSAARSTSPAPPSPPRATSARARRTRRRPARIPFSRSPSRSSASSASRTRSTTLAQAASGAYDATYTSMATTLAGWKNPLLSVRIGWEFNGNWYKWSNGVGTNATYANYHYCRKSGHGARSARARAGQT